MSVLSQVDLSLWYQRLGLHEDAREIVDGIRCSEPARRVGGGKSNVPGLYPSRKMGKTIQFESHRVEFAVAVEMEEDTRVFEYYDQPCQIPLTYCGSNQRRISVMHTPDFFVLRTDSAGWVECKTDKDLVKLAQKSPHRYHQTQDGIWRCPPGEEYASALGLYYRVYPSSRIDWVLVRNICYLDDYLRGESLGFDSKNRELAIACISASPGVSIDELIRRMATPAALDCVHSMIARREIYVDLRAASLTDPTSVRVFRDRESATCGASSPRGRPVNIAVGYTIQWDGATWRVANLGESMIGLVGKDRNFTEVPIGALERLMGEGRVVVQAADNDRGSTDRIHARLATASERDLKIANHRFSVLQSHRYGECEPNVPARTLRFWAARYREAEEAYGDGYIGLLPETQRRGNRQDRLPEKTRTLMAQSIENDFETLKQKSKYACWVALKHTCEQQGVAAPSYRAFRRAVQKRSQFDQTLKRKGRRAAYKYEPPYWELDLTTPRHGDRPFEIGHIDHTELDIELRSLTTGQVLDRPWLTLLVDAFSRRILAMYLTFDPPSYRSCMMVLRDCVRRNARLPQFLVVDGGHEFESTYFETLLARYECTKKTRPPAKSRFGSVVERLFGTCNTQFVHNLRGNTQITRNVRQVTASVDPKGMATWSLRELNERLNEYLFDVYDRMEHPALGQSPREAFARGFEMSGLRLQRLIPYDQNFMLCTMPSTTKGTATVCPGRGVKINHVYYWSDMFRDPEFERRQLPVRYDPFDAGTAYAFCRNQWVECHSEYFTVLRGRSEREIMLATEEIHKRHRLHSARRLNINAKMLAVFLESVEAQEALLVQRACDRESAAVRSGGGHAEHPQDERDGAAMRFEDPATVNEVVEIYGEF
jgi:transposase InsO family protein